MVQGLNFEDSKSCTDFFANAHCPMAKAASSSGARSSEKVDRQVRIHEAITHQCKEPPSDLARKATQPWLSCIWQVQAQHGPGAERYGRQTAPNDVNGTSSVRLADPAFRLVAHVGIASQSRPEILITANIHSTARSCLGISERDGVLGKSAEIPPCRDAPDRRAAFGSLAPTPCRRRRRSIINSSSYQVVWGRPLWTLRPSIRVINLPFER